MDKSAESGSLYDDIDNFDLGKQLDKLKYYNNALEDKILSKNQDIEKLMAALVSMKKVKDNLVTNISSLYLTAKAEIERKDRVIADLRKELDKTKLRKFTRKNDRVYNGVNSNDSSKQIDSNLTKDLKREDNFEPEGSMHKRMKFDGHENKDSNRPIYDHHNRGSNNYYQDRRTNYGYYDRPNFRENYNSGENRRHYRDRREYN